MLVAPWTTDSRVSGIATGVHQDTKTGSAREHNGKTPEKRPSISTTFWSPNLKDKRLFQESFKLIEWNLIPILITYLGTWLS